MSTLRVNLAERSYDIAIGSDDAECSAFLQQRIAGNRAFVIADAAVVAIAEQLQRLLNSNSISSNLAIVLPGETSKSLAQAAELYRQLAEAKADRQTVVVAVGGGVIGDLAGFAAATYNRGLPLLMIPTSLLAMVDSAVGGKVGINLAQGKNLVGAFHQPIGVWIDIRHLETLPDREFRCGLAEVVKYGVAVDAAFFGWLEVNVAKVLAKDAASLVQAIATCCRLKAKVVEEDEFETTGRRMVLNFGHTFAHAFETVGAYAELRHGEAVASGMVCACRLAERLGMIAADVADRVRNLLEALGLPIVPPPPLRVDEWLAVMRRDKKSVSGQLRLVLPTHLGKVTLINGVDESLVREMLSKFL